MSLLEDEVPHFKQWFDIQRYEIMEDVGRGPIENDDGPDERHRFSAPPPKKKPKRRD